MSKTRNRNFGICPHCGEKFEWDWETVLATNVCQEWSFEWQTADCDVCHKPLYVNVEMREFDVEVAGTREEMMDE